MLEQWLRVMSRVFEEYVGFCLNCGDMMESQAVICPPAAITVLDGLVASMYRTYLPDVGLENRSEKIEMSLLRLGVAFFCE